MLFPVEREHQKHLLRYRCHFTRFPYFDAACEEKNVDYEYAEPNEELFCRFFLDVIEEAEMESLHSRIVPSSSGAFQGLVVNN